MEYRHVPVMLNEAIEYLKPQPGGMYIDCTLGGGGYTHALEERACSSGAIVAIDADAIAIENAEKRFKNNNKIFLVHDNFKNLHKIIDKIFTGQENCLFDGIVLDLGLSSAQLEDRHRGLSFQHDTVLDMSFAGANGGNKTIDLVNSWSEDEINNVIKNYGEERYARLIARKIVKERRINKITTTGELLKIISDAVPASYRRNKKIHFATRTFQALRIATNDELNNLEEALPQAWNLLKNGGRLAVVSYHSLEDRIVKSFFKKESRDCICPPKSPTCRCQHRASLKILTKKPLTPTEEEIVINPRARSAKLRVAEKK